MHLSLTHRLNVGVSVLRWVNACKISVRFTAAACFVCVVSNAAIAPATALGETTDGVEAAEWTGGFAAGGLNPVCLSPSPCLMDTISATGWVMAEGLNLRSSGLGTLIPSSLGAVYVNDTSALFDAWGFGWGWGWGFGAGDDLRDGGCVDKCLPHARHFTTVLVGLARPQGHNAYTAF